VIGCWENPGRKGWRVPRDDVEQTVTEAMNRWNVVELACDPPYWEREIAEWTARWPGQVVEIPTYSRARMAPACTGFPRGGDGRTGDPRRRPTDGPPHRELCGQGISDGRLCDEGRQGLTGED